MEIERDERIALSGSEGLAEENAKLTKRVAALTRRVSALLSEKLAAEYRERLWKERALAAGWKGRADAWHVRPDRPGSRPARECVRKHSARTAPPDPVRDINGVAVKSAGEWDDAGLEKAGVTTVGDVATEYVKLSTENLEKPEKAICFSSTVAHGEEICRAMASVSLNVQNISYLDEERIVAARSPSSGSQTAPPWGW
ncbi:hypothetical protein [Reyranella sp.]|uniref:hypothetical protein n=1 Tax=Reyranella sp. TaxID=1929291 RepID=UPI0026190A53|nr:hypothetical protein [Reyranella sp.]HQT15761.1 hypothetical protein [Reyranella sp.]